VIVTILLNASNSNETSTGLNQSGVGLHSSHLAVGVADQRLNPDSI